jgi:mono/diheme cytochrome c family protein
MAMHIDNAIRRACVAVGGAMLAAAVIAGASAEELRVRGAYLVNGIAGCGNCHTPKDRAGRAVAGKELSGGFEFDDPDIGHIVPPNITPDPETGIGKWSEAQIVTAMRDGKRPDGTIIGPPMPIPVYSRLSVSDARAIAAYLRSVKPIRNAVAKTQFKIPLPPAYGPPVTHVDEPPRADKIAYGGYLAGPVGHCVLCHTPPGDGKPFDMSRAYGGGRELPDFAKPGALTVSRNITPDPENGIGKWNDAELKRAITAGVRPDGTKLTRTMPFDWYAKIAPADLDALVAYLRSLKPVK